MATITKQYYESMSDNERELLLEVVSTDNILRGMPSFQEWCATQHSVQRTLSTTEAMIAEIVEFVNDAYLHEEDREKVLRFLRELSSR